MVVLIGTGSVEKRQAERTKQGERRPPAFLGLMFRRYMTALKIDALTVATRSLNCGNEETDSCVVQHSLSR